MPPTVKLCLEKRRVTLPLNPNPGRKCHLGICLTCPTGYSSQASPSLPLLPCNSQFLAGFTCCIITAHGTAQPTSRQDGEVSSERGDLDTERDYHGSGFRTRGLRTRMRPRPPRPRLLTC